MNGVPRAMILAALMLAGTCSGCSGLLWQRVLHPCCPTGGNCCHLGCGEVYWGDHTVDVGPDPCCPDQGTCPQCGYEGREPAPGRVARRVPLGEPKLR